MKIRDIKAAARSSLHGNNYWRIFFAKLLRLILSLLILAAYAACVVYAIPELRQQVVPQIFPGLVILNDNFALIAGALLAVLILILFLFADFFFGIGEKKLLIDICRYGRGRIGDLFYGFRKKSHPLRAVGVGLLITLRLALILVFFGGAACLLQSMDIPQIADFAKYRDYGTIAIIVIGVWVWIRKFVGWAFAQYIVIDTNEVGIRQALSCSFKLSKGRKWKIFWLATFSFIFWVIPAFMTFGLSRFWSEPYREAAMIELYLEALGLDVKRISLRQPEPEAPAPVEAAPAAAAEAAPAADEPKAEEAEAPASAEEPAQITAEEPVPAEPVPAAPEPVPEPVPEPEPEPAPVSPAPEPEPDIAPAVQEADGNAVSAAEEAVDKTISEAAESPAGGENG